MMTETPRTESPTTTGRNVTGPTTTGATTTAAQQGADAAAGAAAARPLRLLVLAAGLSTPSSTRMLADMLSGATRRALEHAGKAVEVRTIELREIARDATDMLLSRVASPRLQEVIDALGSADAVIAVTPIFNTGPSGLFKTFVDALDTELWRGTPVLLGATAGTTRHALALEHAIRPVFVYLKAQLVPTGVFAASSDFGAMQADESDEQPLALRAARAADELAALLTSPAAAAARAAAEAAPEPSGADGDATGLDAEFADFTPMDALLHRHR